MSTSISSPPMRMLRLMTMPPRLMTATSVVPPPISTMRLPVGSLTGRPAPIAAAMGFLNQAGPASPRIHGCVADGTLLDLGHARWDAQQHAWPRHHADAIVNLPDEVLDHLLRHVEVTDDSVAERTDGDDVCRSPAHHALRLGTDGQDPLGLGVHSDDAGLAYDDAAVTNVDKGVGRAQVYPDVSREKAEQCVQAEHD